MNPRKTAIEEMKAAGFQFHRDGRNHEIWIDPESRELIPLSRSSHFSTDDLKMIRSEIKSVLQRKNADRH